MLIRHVRFYRGGGKYFSQIDVDKFIESIKGEAGPMAMNEIIIQALKFSQVEETETALQWGDKVEVTIL